LVSDRLDLLDSYARAYARERFALIFTQGLDKRFGKGWPDAKPVLFLRRGLTSDVPRSAA
jgi:hypothetical protein